MTCDETARALERAAFGPRERMDVDDVAHHIIRCSECRDLAADLLLLGAASAPDGAAPPMAASVAPIAKSSRGFVAAAAVILVVIGYGFGRVTDAGPAPLEPPQADNVVRVSTPRSAPRLPALDPHTYEGGFLAGKSARVYSAK